MHNYVVSDIHGNSERLRFLLASLKDKHSSGDFVLHIIGDLFDRGKSSADVYQLLLKNKNNINLLLGNHECLFMDFMENPKNFVQWQANGAYPTIQSFIDEFLPNLLRDDIIFDTKELRDLYAESYKVTQSKINKIFGKKQENDAQLYINELKYTNSERDLRGLTYYVKSYISKECPHLDRKNRTLVENILYLLLIDKFCEIYKYFLTAKPFEIVDDKFLLVHSGFVSKNKCKNITDSVPYGYYGYCENREDLYYQNPYPMVWSRRYNADNQTRFAPNERFDGLITVFGHTIVSLFRNNNSLNPLITRDADGKIASVGIDGKNYDKERGQLNCICLDDLTMMLISGSNEAHKVDKDIKPMMMSKCQIKNNIPQKQHTIFEAGD